MLAKFEENKYILVVQDFAKMQNLTDKHAQMSQFRSYGVCPGILDWLTFLQNTV